MGNNRDIFEFWEMMELGLEIEVEPDVLVVMRIPGHGNVLMHHTLEDDSYTPVLIDLHKIRDIMNNIPDDMWLQLQTEAVIIKMNQGFTFN